MKTTIRILCAALGLLTLTNCTTQREIDSVAPYSAAFTQQQAGLSPTQERLIDKHCPFGMPVISRNLNVGPTDLVAREGYVLTHSAVKKIPLWVCECVSTNQLNSTLVREGNPFKPDPLLKVGNRSELDDYAESGFDRGHQAPAGNQTRDSKLKDETFYLSNMAPQTPKMNRNVWKTLEELTRDWVKKRGTAYMITGPMFYSTNEESRSTATGMIRHKVIGKNSVYVPTHFFKIVITKDKTGNWDAIGFVIENTPQPKPYIFESYIKPIDWIEQRTGINFMPNLDKTEKIRLTQSASPLWN